MATSYDNLYIINYTDINSGTISIPKGAIVTDRIDVALVGKGTEYGELLDENVLHLLENFASLENPDFPNDPIPDTAHAQVLSPLLEQPTDGQFWFNKTRLQMFVRNNLNQPVDHTGVWKALKFRNDISANSGMIAHGQQIPVPVNNEGYAFSYDECSWIVSPVAFDSKVNYAECYTDNIGTVSVRYRATDSSELTPGLANYLIIGVKGSNNHGVPYPTPTPSILPSNTPTPTPIPSNTPTVSPTPGVSSTPTPTITASLTLTPTVTPTLTRTPTVTPSLSVVIGEIWTERLSSSIHPTLIEYGNGIYVAMNGYYANGGSVYLSGNGISWSYSAGVSPQTISGLKYVNGLFWALGNNYIAVSLDGVSWTQRSDSIGYVNKYIYSIAYNGSRYVNVGYNFTSNIEYITYSDDGFTWNPIASPMINEALRDIAYGNGKFVAVAGSANGTTGGPVIVISSDGINGWTRVYSPVTTSGSALYSIIFANGIFVAVGNEYSVNYYNGVPTRMLVLTSFDGINWTRQTLPNNPYNSLNYLQGITYNAGIGLFFIVGYGGKILSSPDAIIWTEKNSGVSDPLFDIAASNTQCVTIGGYGSPSNGFILSSP